MDNPFVQHAEQQLLRGDPGEALRAARMGLTLFADDRALWEIAASCATQLGDDEYAATCWRRIIALDPSAAHACNNLGLVLERLQRSEEAEAAYRQALGLLPDDASLHTNLGLLLENLGRLDEAERHQRQAVALSPDSAEIHSNLAGLLARRDRAAEAEAVYRAAIRLKPEFATAHSNLGVLLTDLGRQEEAEACFRMALAVEPELPAARMNFGQLLLMQGRFAEGWPLYEGRLFVHAQGGPNPLARPACPQWQGESLVGKSVLVMPEQGLGDEIQFCRYLPWLKAQGVSRLTLLCRPSQKALLETLGGPDAVVSLADAKPQLGSHEYWTLLLSLPLHAGTQLANIPAQIPYLLADPARVARHACLLAGEGRRVGVVWRGNPRHSNDADRSLPGLEVLAPLWAIDGVRFFSLQKSEEALPAVPSGQTLVDLGPAIGDLADTAALLSQLDLLITVDTAIAHLAGALGVPCWILLPCHKTDWRWLQARCDSPWYPKTRLFRQPRRGDWALPVAELVVALRAFRQS